MEMWDWLIKQVPVIVVMGIGIYYLYKELKAKDKLIAKKDESLVSITEQVLKVATLWDVKSDQNSKEHEEIKEGVDDLTELVKTIRYECKGV